MSSDDWKTVLLALIAALVSLGTAFIGAYLEILRRKANVNQATTEAARQAAVMAVPPGAATPEIVAAKTEVVTQSKLAAVKTTST